MHPDKLNELKIKKGDPVILKGKKNSQTICLVWTDSKMNKENILTNKVIRNNLNIKTGDTLIVEQCPMLTNLERINILPFEDTIKGFTENLMDHLTPYFQDKYRPKIKGNIFSVTKGSRTIEFKVVSCEPRDFGVVAPQTIINIESASVKIGNEEASKENKENNNIGGYKKQIGQIKEIIELSLTRSQIFIDLGIQPPGGVLLYGPLGTGKSMITRSLANEVKASFFTVDCIEIMAKKCEEAESILKKTFEEAERNIPSVILIDELDYIASDRDKIQGGTEKRIFCLLLTLLESIKRKGHVFCLATTDNIDIIDPTLRKLGFFDKTVEISLPEEYERLEILRIYTKNVGLSRHVDLIQLAKETEGFAGADLVRLCREAVLNSIKEKVKNNSETNTLTITDVHFKYALNEVKNFKKII